MMTDRNRRNKFFPQLWILAVLALLTMMTAYTPVSGAAVSFTVFQNSAGQETSVRTTTEQATTEKYSAKQYRSGSHGCERVVGIGEVLCFEPRESNDPIVVTRASLRSTLLYESRLSGSERQVKGNEFPMRSAAGDLRSLPLAFGLSAILPGGGQAYNGQWMKAAAAVTAEVVLLSTYFSRRDQGRRAEKDFISFANADWDPVQYGDWLNDYTVFLNAEFGSGIDVPTIETAVGVDFQNPQTWSAENWKAVGKMFAQINATERSVFHPETGANFSHQLPKFASQQYYELVGKYFQFAPGWSDSPAWLDAEGNFTAAIDPEMTATDGSKPNVSDNFFNYADDHAASQNLFRSASKYSLLIVINHIASAIDAVVSAKLHNERIMPRLNIEFSDSGEAVPVAGIGIRL